MIWVVVSLLDVLAYGCTPELKWDIECHARVCIDHVYAHGNSWFVINFQKFKSVFESF